MISAQEFIQQAQELLGIKCYSGVPCSFLTPFINHVINDTELNWICAANEGDALAIAAGAHIGGQPALTMMQNSGLGNAVNPLTSLAWIFRIPILLIITHRGAPGCADEPQHELMGQITRQMLKLMDIPASDFPSESAQIEPTLQRARQYMRSENRPYALIMQKGSVQKVDFQRNAVPMHPQRLCKRESFTRLGQAHASRRQCLERLLKLTANATDIVLIATTGHTGRELYALEDRANHFYMVGSMGCAASLGLGLARAQPTRRIVIIDGDGALLMRMGNLATLGTYGEGNLIHLALDNEMHGSTGGQASVSANVQFADMAAASGYGCAFSGDDPQLIDALLDHGDRADGPRFGHLKINDHTTKDLPRPTLPPAGVCLRLMQHIGCGHL
ncbi:MAG: phosphonopyruvate decarboxylase [Candidatus Eutrophobiaceae bacterium]